MIENAEIRNPQPGVTVLMASHGRLEMLKEAVGSALDQEYPEYRILIVDDGSDHETIEWLKQLESSHELVTVHYRNHEGVASARHYGVEKAETDLICILDSDDILAPNALGVLLGMIRQRPSAQLVYPDIREIRPGGEMVVQHYRQYASTRSMTIVTLVKPRLPFKHSGTLFRRETARKLGSYDVRLPCKVDVDLYLKFMKAGYLPVHVDEPLVDFRMHKNSISIDRLTGIRVWMKLIDRYGPGNRLYRTGMKCIRLGAEVLKRVYVEIRG